MPAAASPRTYIFCVSPGRSGPYYLSRLFFARGRCLRGPRASINGLRMPRCGLIGGILKNRPLSDSFTERRHLKLSQVSDPDVPVDRYDVYAETNPLFSTLWHDVILDGLSGHEARRHHLAPLRAQGAFKSLLDLGWFSDPTRGRLDGHAEVAFRQLSLLRPARARDGGDRLPARDQPPSQCRDVRRSDTGPLRWSWATGSIELRAMTCSSDPDTIHGLLAQCGLRNLAPLAPGLSATTRAREQARNEEQAVPRHSL